MILFRMDFQLATLDDSGGYILLWGIIRETMVAWQKGQRDPVRSRLCTWLHGRVFREKLYENRNTSRCWHWLVGGFNS